MLEAIGFWSYARQDDAHSDGQLSHLRAIVGKAIILQKGAEVTLWQDIAAIPYGADWATTIEQTISKTTFFIPIITPRFLNSEHCCAEFTSFRYRMEQIGRDNLIFPVHYVSVDDVLPADTVFGEHLSTLRRSQWIDFRPLFYADTKSPEVRRWAGDLASSVLHALREPAPPRVGGDRKQQDRAPNSAAGAATLGISALPAGSAPQGGATRATGNDAPHPNTVAVGGTPSTPEAVVGTGVKSKNRSRLMAWTAGVGCVLVALLGAGYFLGGFYPAGVKSRVAGPAVAPIAPSLANPNTYSSSKVDTKGDPGNTVDTRAPNPPVFATPAAIAALKSMVPAPSTDLFGVSNYLRTPVEDAPGSYTDDYLVKVESIINQLAASRATNASPRITIADSDITEHEVLDALDNEIRAANLTRFESFLGESWSPERLRVMILDQLRLTFGYILDAGAHGTVTMHDVDSGIAQSARRVHARLFEISEMLASDRGSLKFLQRLYQVHGELGGDARASFEQQLSASIAAGFAPLQALVQRDPNAVALRYRGERIIFDCLTDNAEAISSNASGFATADEMEKNVADAISGQCSKWVTNQLIAADGKLKPQSPMPLRTVWSAEGPRDDPSMYGRAADEL